MKTLEDCFNDATELRAMAAQLLGRVKDLQKHLACLVDEDYGTDLDPHDLAAQRDVTEPKIASSL